MTSFSIHTLGCRLNQADSASVAGDLTAIGFQAVPWGMPSDIAIINSCAVTGVASQKSRQALRAVRKRLPDAFIVMMGCEATLADPSKYPEADLIYPNPKSAPLSQLLPATLTHCSGCSKAIAPGNADEDFTQDGVALYDDRTRANLKVQEGCDFYCTYCIVPYTRGHARSRNFSDVMREAEALLKHGHKEIVLTGVNITTYQNNGMDLADLIEQLLTLSPDFRIRLGSAEPGSVVPKIVDLMADHPRLCRFLHLPVQYGEDSILRQMGRHYDTAQFAQLAENAAARIPGLCLGTDVIVGFPGETDETFRACKDFLTRMPFGLMHVFTYSPRPGTPAAEMPNRPSKAVAEKRSEELLELSQEKAEAFAKSQIGRKLDILIEEENPASGWTDNYLHATLTKTTPDCHRQAIVSATITAAPEKRELLAEAAP